MLDPRTLGVQKLAALGAVAAAGALVLVLGAVFFFLHPYPRGGMDVAHYTLTLMAFTGLLGAIIVGHLVLGHQLWHGPVAGSAGEEPRVARIRRKARS